MISPAQCRQAYLFRHAIDMEPRARRNLAADLVKVFSTQTQRAAGSTDVENIPCVAR